MKSRYEGSQNLLWNIKSACFFLCLLSIAEEYLNKKIDLIDATRYCLEKGWIDEEFYIKNDCAILSWLVGKKVSKKTVESIERWGILLDNQYSVVKYVNPEGTGYHFRRRGFDVYENSYTVREGRLLCYYIYTIDIG